MEVHVHASNRSAVNKVLLLVDEKGKHICNQTHAAFIELVGRFPYESGNYMDEDTMLKNLPGKKICLRTLKNNLKYLLCMGILERFINKDRRVAYRVKEIKEDQKENMASFRKRIGAYNYHKKCQKKKSLALVATGDMFCLPDEITLEGIKMGSEGDNNDTFEIVFNEKQEEKFSKNGENFSRSICGKVFLEKGKIFPAPPKGYEIRDNPVTPNLKSFDLKKHHPIVPPLEVLESETSRGVLGDEESEELKVLTEEKKPKRNEDQDRLPDSPAIKSIGNSEVKIAEPLIGAKRQSKARKTTKERLIEATQSYSEGHITNPIGKPDTRGRMLKPSRARPISESGSVTVAQLWASYLEIFANAFGESTILENLMPPTREYMTTFFGQMRQKFLDYSGKTVDNRVLYEYLVWYHDPKRLSQYYNPAKGFVHPLQLMGAVTIKKFADQHVGIKTNELISEGVIQARKLTQFLIEAFDIIREKHEDNFGLVQCLTNYGFVVVGEYLNDYHGWDASRCKERMIEVLADFIVHSKNKENAKKFIARAWERTKTNKVIESTIWTNWEEACKNFVSLAIEKAERSNHEREGTDHLPTVDNGQGTGEPNKEPI